VCECVCGTHIHICVYCNCSWRARCLRKASHYDKKPKKKNKKPAKNAQILRTYLQFLSWLCI